MFCPESSSVIQDSASLPQRGETSEQNWGGPLWEMLLRSHKHFCQQGHSPQSGTSFLRVLHQPRLQGHPCLLLPQGNLLRSPYDFFFEGLSLLQEPHFHHSKTPCVCGPQFYQNLTSNMQYTVSVANEVYYADTQTTALREQSPFERLCTQKHSSQDHYWGDRTGRLPPWGVLDRAPSGRDCQVGNARRPGVGHGLKTLLDNMDSFPEHSVSDSNCLEQTFRHPLPKNKCYQRWITNIGVTLS